MKFLFDIDEVLYIGDIIETATSQLKGESLLEEDAEYNGNDAEDYQFSNFPKVLHDRILKLFSDPLVACVNKEPLPGAYAFLYALQNKGHQLGLITSRPAPLKEPTKYVIWRDFPGIKFSYSCFVNDTEFHKDGLAKKEPIAAWGPDFYFDDYHGYCKDALDANVPNVFLISNSHTGWNRKFKSELLTQYPNRLKVVKSILDFDLRSI